MQFHVARKYLFLLVLVLFASGATAKNVVFVVIDGARYSETLGDPARQFVPVMGALADEGAYADSIFNDGFTYTSRAIPALWCGSWTEVRDTVYEGMSTQYSVDPTIFEYFRRQTGAPEDQCVYVLKSLSSLWLPSFNPEYGPEYWPTLHSVGSADADVCDEALATMQASHPRLLWVYFADVDHAGHSGDWQAYTHAITTADSLVGVLWDAIQSDSAYRDSTYMFVTNDHGRHDDAHGGFSGHGDDCPGCRHIMFLAMGPKVRPGYVSTVPRVLPDAMVTAADRLGLETEYSTGQPMSDLFREPVSVAEPGLPLAHGTLVDTYPNPFNPRTTIRFVMEKQGPVRLSVYDTRGRLVRSLRDGITTEGQHRVVFDADGLPSGTYYCRLETGTGVQVRKMLLVK